MSRNQLSSSTPLVGPRSHLEEYWCRPRPGQRRRNSSAAFRPNIASFQSASSPATHTTRWTGSWKWWRSPVRSKCIKLPLCCVATVHKTLQVCSPKIIPALSTSSLQLSLKLLSSYSEYSAKTEPELLDHCLFVWPITEGADPLTPRNSVTREADVWEHNTHTHTQFLFKVSPAAYPNRGSTRSGWWTRPA